MSLLNLKLVLNPTSRARLRKRGPTTKVYPNWISSLIPKKHVTWVDTYPPTDPYETPRQPYGKNLLQGCPQRKQTVSFQPPSPSQDSGVKTHYYPPEKGPGVDSTLQTFLGARKPVMLPTSHGWVELLSSGQTTTPHHHSIDSRGLCLV